MLVYKNINTRRNDIVSPIGRIMIEFIQVWSEFMERIIKEQICGANFVKDGVNLWSEFKRSSEFYKRLSEFVERI